MVAAGPLAQVGLLPNEPHIAAGNCVGFGYTNILCGGTYTTKTPGTPHQPHPPAAERAASRPPAIAPNAIIIAGQSWPFPGPSPSRCGPPNSPPVPATANLTVGKTVLNPAGPIPLLTVGPCTVAPAPRNPPANGRPAAMSPAVVAAQYWQRVPLPAPHPTVPPGWALCGKAAFLVTGGTTTPPATTNRTPLGPLTITPAGTYWVNWGDGGGWAGPYHGEGRAWPAGTITHTYDTAGAATILVRETWTATWSLGAARGTLTGLTTTATIPALPVRQLQTALTDN